MSSQRPTDVPPIGDWNRLLDGRVAVVTGGGDGIGGAISSLFAQHGALVEIADLDPERAAATVATIEEHGGHARAHRTDVTDPSDVERLASDGPRPPRSRRRTGQQRRGLPSADPIRRLDPRVVARHVRHQPVPRLRRHPCLPREHDHSTDGARSSTSTRWRACAGSPGSRSTHR